VQLGRARPIEQGERTVDFEFSKAREVRGHLVQVVGRHVGVRLPLHAGITHVGRGTEGRCEYRNREGLRGVVEQSQVLVKADAGRFWVTDATSTNPTTLVRREQVSAFLAGELSGDSAGVVELEHERLETDARERRWTELRPGDHLSHVYGCWELVAVDGAR